MTVRSRPVGTTSPGDELVDVVDAEDTVLTTVTRREMRAGALRHRAVYLLVVSAAGELLVHQRSFDKDVCPGWWDVAAGGVVASAESYDEAASRELFEELGIAAPLELLGRGVFDNPLVHIVGRVYLARHDGPFEFSDGEVIAAEWIAPDLLPALLSERKWCPDSVALALPLLPAL